MLVGWTIWNSYCAYLFNVKEDGIETKEHKGNGSSEPPESLVALYVCVEPCSLGCPALRLMVVVVWVRRSEDERKEAGDCGKTSNATDCVVESK
jgi:hypothetical protein